MFKDFRKNIYEPNPTGGPGTQDPRPTSTPPKLLQVLKVNQQQKGSRRPESGGMGRIHPNAMRCYIHMGRIVTV